MSVREGGNTRQLQASGVVAPPKKLHQMLRWVGPSLIVAAAAVGSGEVVNATQLGAIAGLTVIWTVFWGVLLKGFIQQEIGRYTLVTRKSIFKGLAEIPGPRIMGNSWFFWAVVLLLIFVILVIVAGIGGAIGGALNVLAPVFSASTWGILAMLSIIPILLIGTYIPRLDVYSVVERSLTLVVVGLTLIMVYISFVAIPMNDNYSYSVANLIGGMTFQLPQGATLASLAVLGTIGAGIELIFYSSWLRSKGLLQHSYNDRDSAEQRTARTRSWLNVVKLDTWVGVVLTLIVSAAYFIAGATVLNELGTVPEGDELISQTASIFSEILGSASIVLFVIGAFIALFATALAIADGAARMAGDVASEMVSTSLDGRQSVLIYRWAVLITILAWVVFFRVVNAPALLIAIGGAVLSLLFPLYGVALLYLNRQVSEQHRMSVAVKIALVLSFFLFTSVWVVGAIFG